MEIISLIKEKKKHIIDFFEWKIHFNLMPKVSGLPQYNIPCIFHCHLNKILLNYQNASSAQQPSLPSSIDWISNGLHLTQPDTGQVKQVYHLDQAKKVTENGEVLMCYNSNQNTTPVKASSLNFSSPKYTPV